MRSRSTARPQGAHGGHPDFRAGGKVFASLGYPGEEWGMVKLDARSSSRCWSSAEPAMFVPVKGTWGLRGATSVRLAEVDARTLRSALTMAWQNVTAPKPEARRPLHDVRATRMAVAGLAQELPAQAGTRPAARRRSRAL